MAGAAFLRTSGGCGKWCYKPKRTSGAKEGAEKVALQTEDVPQGLKPYCKQNTSGTAEAVPLSKTDFLNTLYGPTANKGLAHG
jgi:hypothetical protein